MRVIVLGTSGAGKSTFARQLAEAWGCPYTDLDDLYSYTGQSREAEVVSCQALAICRQLAADFPAVPDYRLGLARVIRPIVSLVVHRQSSYCTPKG